MSFEEPIMSKDKYASISSCQMEAIVFDYIIILQMKTLGYSPVFCWGTFIHVMHLDQSRAGP